MGIRREQDKAECLNVDRRSGQANNRSSTLAEGTHITSSPPVSKGCATVQVQSTPATMSTAEQSRLHGTSRLLGEGAQPPRQRWTASIYDPQPAPPRDDAMQSDSY
jgi:hypothetical protein